MNLDPGGRPKNPLPQINILNREFTELFCVESARKITAALGKDNSVDKLP